jgi:hypothetical protein
MLFARARQPNNRCGGEIMSWRGTSQVFSRNWLLGPSLLSGSASILMLAGALRGVGAIKASVRQRWPRFGRNLGLHVNPLD